MFAEKNTRILRPIAMNRTVTGHPRGGHPLLQTPRCREHGHREGQRPLTAEDAQQFQTNLPCGKSAEKLTRLVIKPMGRITERSMYVPIH